MVKHFCDICGNEMNDYRQRLEVIIKPYSVTKDCEEYEICDTCIETLKRFIANGGNTIGSI